jgi:LysM repeat protein
MFANAARLFAIACVASLAQVSYAANCSRKYTIKEGDICDSISAANNVSTYQLGAVNAGKINEACSNLVIGEEICLATEGEDCSNTYTVVKGDTCSKIWDNHGVNSTILYANNPQIDEECSNVYLGEVLCIGDSVRAPPVPSVPIHTGPPAGEATPTPAAPAAVNAAPIPSATSSTVAAPTPTAAPADEDDEECEEGEEEYEIVYGPGNEDLPFCDDL